MAILRKEEFINIEKVRPNLLKHKVSEKITIN